METLHRTVAKSIIARISIAIIAVAISSILGAPREAVAGAFQLFEQNASGLGNAYAGQAAVAEDASAAFYNPASMTQLPGTRVAGALDLIKTSINFSDSGASLSPIPGLVPLGDNGGNAGSWNAIPAFHLTHGVSENMWLGLSITAPFGLNTDYDSNFIGRFQSQNAGLKTYDVNPSIAWKVNQNVSLGAGISYQHTEFTLDRSAVTGINPFTSQVFLGSTHLDVSDGQWGWNIGVLFNFDSGTHVGLSYRSSIGYNLSGDLTTTNIPLAGNVTAPVAANIRFPDTYSIGIRQKFNDSWEGLAGFSYTRWSAIQSVPLMTTGASAFGPAGSTLDTFNYQFSDSYHVALGINYKIIQDLILKFGTAYDKTPIDDQYRTVSLPDSSYTWLTIGAKYMLSKQTTFDIGYAHLFYGASTINQTAPFQGTVAGSYSNSADILGAQLSYIF